MSSGYEIDGSPTRPTAEGKYDETIARQVRERSRKLARPHREVEQEIKQRMEIKVTEPEIPAVEVSINQSLKGTKASETTHQKSGGSNTE